MDPLFIAALVAAALLGVALGVLGVLCMVVLTAPAQGAG